MRQGDGSLVSIRQRDGSLVFVGKARQEDGSVISEEQKAVYFTYDLWLFLDKRIVQNC